MAECVDVLELQKGATCATVPEIIVDNIIFNNLENMWKCGPPFELGHQFGRIGDASGLCWRQRKCQITFWDKSKFQHVPEEVGSCASGWWFKFKTANEPAFGVRRAIGGRTTPSRSVAGASHFVSNTKNGRSVAMRYVTQRCPDAHPRTR